MTIPERAIEQIDSLIAQYRPTVRESEFGGGVYIAADPAIQQAAHARLAQAVDRLTLPGSSYREEASRIEESGHHASFRAADLLGVLMGVREDYAAGYMQSVEEIVHADLFADFLEMASELLNKGFKDPAAVLAGSVLEEHLRKLATKSSVAVADAKGQPRKADAINADLGRSVYNKLEQKSVTAWLDLRNKAAHAEYDQYDHRQVASLIDSVRDFMLRHPA